MQEGVKIYADEKSKKYAKIKIESKDFRIYGKIKEILEEGRLVRYCLFDQVKKKHNSRA